MLFNKLSLVFLLLLLSLSACQIADLEDIERADYQAEYAIPLINTSFSMHDVLENFEENSVLTVLPDGTLRLQYSGNLLTETADDVLQSIVDALTTAGLILITSTETTLPFATPDGLEIDRMDLKSGTLNFAFVNCAEEEITASITFPSVTLNGSPLVITRTVEAYDGEGACPILSTIQDEIPYDLTGYQIAPVDGLIKAIYHAEDASGVEYAPAFGTNISISDFAFSYLEGYLGQIDHSGPPDVIDIDFFDNWIRGDVFFEEPVINFHIENSFGIPTRSVIRSFNIITVNNDTLPFLSDHITNGVDFPYPELDEVGAIKIKDFIFDKDNSNITTVLGSSPVAIEYDIDAATNPDGNTELRGFVTDSSFYKVRIDVDLPLYGWAINFSTRDTFDLDFSSLDRADYAEFKIISENSMPVAIGLQGYFYDENGAILDSLFQNSMRVIEGADVDPNGNPVGSNEIVTFIDFPADRFASLRKTKKLEILATFFTSTEGAQSVRIKDEQDVKIRMGAIFGVSEK